MSLIFEEGAILGFLNTGDPAIITSLYSKEISETYVLSELASNDISCQMHIRDGHGHDQKLAELILAFRPNICRIIKSELSGDADMSEKDSRDDLLAHIKSTLKEK